MRNKRHDISPLSDRARALLLLTIEKIEQTGMYNQDSVNYQAIVHTCGVQDSPLCIVGWMNAIAGGLGLNSTGLTEEQRDRLYWHQKWPKKFQIYGKLKPDGSKMLARDISPGVGIARIRCFLKSGGTR